MGILRTILLFYVQIMEQTVCENRKEFSCVELWLFGGDIWGIPKSTSMAA